MSGLLFAQVLVVKGIHYEWRRERERERHGTRSWCRFYRWLPLWNYTATFQKTHGGDLISLKLYVFSYQLWQRESIHSFQ